MVVGGKLCGACWLEDGGWWLVVDGKWSVVGLVAGSWWLVVGG